MMNPVVEVKDPPLEQMNHSLGRIWGGYIVEFTMLVALPAQGGNSWCCCSKPVYGSVSLCSLLQIHTVTPTFHLPLKQC